MKLDRRLLGAAAAALATQLPLTPVALAQMENGPATETQYGVGLPRDHAALLYKDSQYPVFALTKDQKAYADINGARMKQDIVNLSNIAVRYRDTTHQQWWGRFPGTTADFEGVQYMLDEFHRLGIQTFDVPYTIPSDWRPTEWSSSYDADGKTINLATLFPASGTKPMPSPVTAEAVWVGVGSEADFIGRDVAGKAVIIYSVFVPGGRSHSASDRAGLFNANTRAAQKGAAIIIDVMNIPGNGQFQPEGGNKDVTQFTLSQDEGFALRDRLGNGEKIMITAHLTVPPLHNVQTAWHYAILPGMSDEQIQIQMHTDGYFYAAEDNNGGMAAGLELARHYAALPIHKRPRTMVWIMFPDHHHGEVAHNMDGGINDTWPWDKVALKVTLEHPSESQLYLYNEDLTGSNTMSATRWSAVGSPEFERMAFNDLLAFGNSVYSIEDGPKNGNFVPSFHTINHIIYHTSLDAPEMVPAEGQARATRAFAAIIDGANKMTMQQLKGPGWPYPDETGSLDGAIGN
ncbi:MAG TPA: hypothetical protein VGI14_19330 [Casimicrobiaceae bacterium]|jgi:hypothetical protein